MCLDHCGCLFALGDYSHPGGLFHHAAPQSLVQSLTKSFEIVKAQRKHAKAQLVGLQEKLDKQQQQHHQQLGEPHQSQDLEDLQLKLVDLNNMVLDIDISIKAVTEEVASCQRPDEKEIHSTRLVRSIYSFG